jgi:hypothetical protein
VSAEEIEHLRDPTDRKILTLLLGASESPAYVQYYSSNLARASFRLVGPLIDSVLPVLAGSERLLLRTSAREELLPIGWDDGPAWQFSLDISIVDDERIQVGGVLRRDGRDLSVADPLLVFDAGFLIADGRLARLEHRGAFAWLAELRRVGVMHFPRSAAPKLTEALARSRVEPESLPDDLRYERVVDAVARPRVRIARAHGGKAHVPREDLEAIAEFEYGGSVLPAHGGPVTYDNECRRLVVRDPAAEQAALQRLHQLGFRRGWGHAGVPGQLTVGVDQFPRAVRTLVREGWHVEADGRVFRAPRAFEVHVKSGIDWFELHGTVDFGDGRSASPTIWDSARR